MGFEECYVLASILMCKYVLCSFLENVQKLTGHNDGVLCMAVSRAYDILVCPLKKFAIDFFNLKNLDEWWTY